MSSPSEPSGGAVSEIAQQLGGIFRHLLPGVVVVSIILAAYPNLAGQFKDFESPKIAVAAVITFSIGNAWFLFNRYVVN